MDPLSHAALGGTLGAAARGDRRLPGAVPATIAGALAPDVDAVMMPFGWDRYLAIHEIGTHSIPGTVACALLVAMIVRRFVAEASWRALVLAGWAGATCHVLLDLLSSARIRALWPIVDRQFSIPLVAMADPWLAALLVCGLPALWARRWFQRSRPAEGLARPAGRPSGRTGWFPPSGGSSEARGTLPAKADDRSSTAHFWLTRFRQGYGGLPKRFARRRRPEATRETLAASSAGSQSRFVPQRRLAMTLLGVTGLFLAIKGGLAIAAVRAYSTHAAGPSPAVFQVQATWAALREWDIFDRTPSQLRVWHATAGAGAPELRLTWPLVAESDNVSRSRSLSVVRNFLRAHTLVFAVTVPQTNEGELVLWSDIRFCWNAANAGSLQLEPVVETDGSTMACGLWFGAELDREGRFVRQIVRIGSFTQTRAPDG
jgi:membrane-bound metal-dependent hydrolase YbcI (DUF457 family)